MRKAIKLTSLSQIFDLQRIIRATDMSLILEDNKGTYVDPRSILGTMSMNLSEPVYFIFDDKNICIINDFEKSLDNAKAREKMIMKCGGETQCRR